MNTMDIVRANKTIERLRSDRDKAVAAAARLVAEHRDMTADRDEWRDQHENLLAINQSQTVEIARLKEQAAIDRDFIEQYQRACVHPEQQTDKEPT